MKTVRTLRILLGRFLQLLHRSYVALKLLVAVAISPLLVFLFFAWNDAFLALMTFLWPHLDILGPEGDLYLRRFFMTPKTKWYRPRFLHLINRSDEGREPHDHPGRFGTRILRKEYRENVYYPRDPNRAVNGLVVQVRTVRAGDKLDNPIGHTHMVTLTDGPTWTWVVAWNRGKPWGFWLLHPTDGSKDRWVESIVYGVKGVELESWETPSWIRYIISGGNQR
jgi:hypothetical protein